VPTPITWAPSKQFLLIGNESAQGTAVAGTWTQLIDSLKPKDMPKWLADKAWRGAMATDSFNEIPGVKAADIEVGGPVFGDGIGFWLRNILGDLSTTGTPTGSGSTTLGTGGAAAGAMSFPAVASIPNGTIVQIGTGATAECVTTGTPTGSGPYTIPITLPSTGLVYTHAAAQPVVPVTGPYTYAWSLLNSGGGQPISHTLTHYLGPTATSGARQYPGFCASELDFKFNAESELLMFDCKGTAYPSVILGSQPTASPSSVIPIASWQTTVGIGGTVSGSPVTTVSDGEIDIKRELGVFYNANGAQTPFIIQRGGLSVSGKLNFAAVPNEAALLYMLNNTQPQVQIITSNGLSGTNLVSIQFDIQVAAFEEAEPETSKTAVGYNTSFKAVLNTTNAGGSGSYSPIKVTVVCNVPPNTY
jgi:hypothetical protein